MARGTIDKVAQAQHGLVTGAQLTVAGWTEGAIRQARRRGELVQVRRNVFRTAGAPATRAQAWLAAVLAVGDGAVVSHASAADLWGFRGFDRSGAVDLLRPGCRPRLRGVRGHETDNLPPAHCTVRERIPVTTAARTLVDSCGLVTPRMLSSAVNDGLRRRVVTLPQLARTVDEVPRSGRRKIVPMVELLRDRIVGYDPGDSDPEADLVRMLTRAGFPAPEQQIKVVAEGHTMYLDVGWSSVKTAFEYDSVEFHVFKFHEDRERLRRLKRAGWDVWPITSETTTNEILSIATLAFRHEHVA